MKSNLTLLVAVLLFAAPLLAQERSARQARPTAPRAVRDTQPGPKTVGEIIDAGVEDRPLRPPPGRGDENVAEFDDRNGREQDEPTPRTSGQACSPWFSRHGISDAGRCAKKTVSVAQREQPEGYIDSCLPEYASRKATVKKNWPPRARGQPRGAL